MTIPFRATAWLACLLAVPAASLSGQTLLLRQPTVSARHIAFAYANNIWIVAREGGDATRLTSFQGVTSHPRLSPDGRWVAFSGQYGGNTDVYVVPAEGGEPRRLTWYPGPDVVSGWSPDGRRVVFTSSRTAAPSFTFTQFWTVPLEGGAEDLLPIPRGAQGTYSPDGARFAYRMPNPWDEEFRNYRGGQNRPIWIQHLTTREVVTPPWTDSEDMDPVWVGETVYFISDRDLLANVWAFDTRGQELRQITRFTDYDVKSLGSGGGAVVFEQAGRVHLLDPATGRSEPVPITVRGDFPWLAPRWESVGPNFTTFAISATGRRAFFEARGDIFSVPAEKGDWRNLTATSGAAERTPSSSPDGKWVSWFSDRTGEYQLVIASQDGSGTPREIRLERPSFYFTPQWSPDSRKMLFTDTGLRLWVVDVETGQAVHADTDAYMVPDRSMHPSWSPDSRYIAYAKRLPTQLHAIFVYDVERRRVHQITDGASDATWPAWDASGKYLWFLASTNFGLNTGWLEMSSFQQPVTRSLQLAILASTEPSPLLPESDEEGAASPAPAGSTPVTVTLDVDGIGDRIVPVPLALRDYAELRAGPAGTVFLMEAVPATGTAPAPGSAVLHRYQLRERRAAPFVTGVQAYTVSGDGKKLLYRASGPQGAWHIVDSDKAPPAPGAGRLATQAMRTLVDPPAEFVQMFGDGWRFQRDFLYVPNMHGVDFTRTMAMYRPMLEHVRHRADLQYLMDMMGGEIAVGHSFVTAGDLPDVPVNYVGQLGADYVVEGNQYRLAKLYAGDPWNPQLRGPLGEPGLDVRVGDAIVAINGVPLTARDNIWRLLDGTVGRQTVLTLSRAGSSAPHRVTVVPIVSEAALRQYDWVESNRRKVHTLSNGRLAYVYVPNTAGAGYTSFNRYFFAQQDREGVIIDERFNGGGSAADYIVDILARTRHGYFNNPVHERKPFTTPQAGIWGAKVMIVNELAGSGGDLLPYMFRRMQLGPLVGTRTWGGLVGTWDTPPLVDGGVMIAPRGGFFDLEGRWAVENEGVAPDIEVEMTPRDVLAGRDPQLERAVAEALRLLRERPVEFKPEPPPPVRTRRPR